VRRQHAGSKGYGQAGNANPSAGSHHRWFSFARGWLASSDRRAGHEYTVFTKSVTLQEPLTRLLRQEKPLLSDAGEITVFEKTAQLPLAAPACQENRADGGF
jgi:hypothetical protein